MGSKLNLEIKVGIFAFVGLVVLTLAVFSISDVYFLSPGYSIKIYFTFASGIDVGAPVRVAGIEAGEVKAINVVYDPEQNKTRVELSVWVNRGVNIPQDSKAFVSVLGLIGETYLEIIPGDDYAKVLKNGDMLLGRDPLSQDTLVETVHKVAENFNQTLSAFNDVLDEDSKKDLKATIHNIRNFSESLDDETKQAFKESILNFRDLTASIKVITGRLERGEGKLGAWLKPRKSRSRK